MVIAFCIFKAVTPAVSADPGDCPPQSTPQTYAGTMTVSGTTIPIPLDLHPCETVGFSITTTGNATFGATVEFKLFNAEESPRVLYETWWSAYGTVSKPSLPTGAPWIYPYRGTRGMEGLPGFATLRATFFSGHTLAYTVVVTRTPRADYNLGGTSFGGAPLIGLTETQYGSVHPWEPGQFYKVSLTPAQTIYLSGEVTGSPTYGTTFVVELYDSNQVYIKDLVNVAAYGTQALPATSTFPTFTPPGPENTDYFLKVVAKNWPAHDFQLQVGLAPCAVPVGFGLDPLSDPTIEHSVPRLTFDYAWSSSTGNLADLSACQLREKVVRPLGYNTYPSPPFAAGDTKPNPEYVVFPVSGSEGVISDLHDTAIPFVKPYAAISMINGQSFEYRCPCANSNNWTKIYDVFGGIKREFAQNADGSWRFSLTKHGLTATKSPLQ